MNFASDNTAGVAPKILDAVACASEGSALGYGSDELTKRVERRFVDLFEHEAAVFLVTTGTAANAIALAQLAPPWGAVLCHAESHIVTDEAGAPEFFGGGLKLVELTGEGCKIVPDTLRAALARFTAHRPHEVIPSVFSLTQATEAGTSYSPEEIRQLADMAHERGLAVHMDGARFANALVRLGVTPAELTWKAGVDALSFGATKGGAMAAEAIVFFDPQRARDMPERRKRGGHLLSKHRFVAAQMEAFLADHYWLDLARHANRLADRLAGRLTEAGVPPLWQVQANLLFVVLPKVADARLRAAGATYYVRQSGSLPPGVAIGADQMLVRLVTSFATSEDEVDRFAELVRAALA